MRTGRIVLAVAMVWGIVSVATAAELVLEWKFDGNLNDTSGSGIHGNPFPTDVTPVFADGVSGQALVSDGARCAFKTGIDTSILPVLAEDTWSVNVWLYPTEIPQDWRIVWSLGQRPEANNSRALYSSGYTTTVLGQGEITFVGVTMPPGGSRSVSWLVSHIPWTVNEWQMMTTTYDGSIVRVYRNGVLLAMRPMTFADAPGEVRIPMHINGVVGSYFPGKFDEFTVWRGKLSHEQIMDLIIPGVIDDVELNQQVVYYRMEDVGAGGMPDHSGLGNDGDLFGIYPPYSNWLAPGFRNEALLFDGGQAVDPPIVVGQPVNYTISFWFKSGHQPWTSAFCQEKQVADIPGRELEQNKWKGSELIIRANNAELQAFSKERDTNTLFLLAADGSAYLDGQTWHHLALVADGEAAQARMYINGQLLVAGDYLRSSHKTATMQGNLGYAWGGGDFLGVWDSTYMDEFKMWNGALTEAQIRAIAAMGNFNNDYQVDIDDFAVVAKDWGDDTLLVPPSTHVVDDMEGTLDNWEVHVSGTYSGTGTIGTTGNAYAGSQAMRWNYDLPARTGGNYTSIVYDIGQTTNLSGFDLLTMQLYRHAANTAEELLFVKFIDASNVVKAEAWIEGAGSVEEPADEWAMWQIDLDNLLGEGGSGTAGKSDLTAIRYVMLGTGGEGRTDARTGVIDIDNVLLEVLPVCDGRPLADLNFDCVVDIKDLEIFASEWLTGIE